MDKNDEPVIITGVSVPKGVGMGRPRGSGLNMRLVSRLKPGDASSCIICPNWKRANSLRVSAARMNVKVKMRQWVDAEGNTTGEYAIFRIT